MIILKNELGRKLIKTNADDNPNNKAYRTRITTNDDDNNKE